LLYPGQSPLRTSFEWNLNIHFSGYNTITSVTLAHCFDNTFDLLFLWDFSVVETVTIRQQEDL
jgi:hypothetical protein